MLAEQSEKIDDLVKDLVKALAEIPHPHKDAVNPHFKSKFASLPGVIDTVRPVLARHGLAVLQTLGSGERGPVVHTTILHRSGQWLRQPALEVPAVKQDPQAYGSAASYGRRYALLAVCGVTGDEDDDGNEAARPAPQKKPAPVKAPDSIKKPVEDGNWLLNKTLATDRSLSAAGRIRSGALSDAFSKEADRHGYPADPRDWDSVQVSAMKSWVMAWVADPSHVRPETKAS